jgi:hypothetical protein
VIGESAETASIGLPVTGRDALPRAVRSLAGGRAVAAWLVGIALLSIALRLCVAWRISAPWTFPDELVYSEFARSFAATGDFAVRGHGWSAWTFGPLYPILIAPVYGLVRSLPDAYLIVKAINCVLFSSAVAPAYLLARRILERRTAVVLSALAVLLPSGIYTAKVMTESLAYPLFLWATVAIVAVLEHPSKRREALALAAMLLAALSRGQFIVLLPAFVCSVVLLAALSRRDAFRRDGKGFISGLRAYPVTWLTLGGIGTIFVVLRFLHVSSSSIAGGHSQAFRHASLTRVLESFVLHIAQLDLYVALLPLVTLVIVSSQAFARGGSREARAICAFTISITCWLAAISARYLVGVDQHAYLSVYDRYDFYVVPLLLIIFLFWLQHDLVRPRWTIWVAGGAAGLPLLIPFSHVLYGWTISSGAVAQLPWLSISLLAGNTLIVYPVLLLAGVGLAYLLVRSRSADPLLFVVIANVLVLNGFALLSGSIVTKWVVAAGVGHDVKRSWIDSATKGQGSVAVLWSGFERRGSKGWYSIWESELFNRNVGAVYDLREPMNYRMPAAKVVIRDGMVYFATGKPLRARYVLTDVKTRVVGTEVGNNGDAGMVLYRVDGPVRLLRSVRLQAEDQ